MQKIREVAKFVVALIGAVLTAGSTLVPEAWGPWLSLALALATAVAVYQVPNAPTGAVKAQMVADAETIQQHILGSR